MISVIIPTLNEAENIERILQNVTMGIGQGIAYEIIISDGGSTDDTIAIASKYNIKVVADGAKGRAKQMNKGAALAKGEILYFLHADTFPPSQFGHKIYNYFNKGYHSGCFRLKFDSKHWVLKFSGWASRFNAHNFQFGDQSLFVKRDLFYEIGGFREDRLIMEDVEIVTRIKKNKNRFIVMPYNVTTSARRYIKNGILKTESTNFLVFMMYNFGAKQETIVKTYKRILKN